MISIRDWVFLSMIQGSYDVHIYVYTYYGLQPYIIIEAPWFLVSAATIAGDCWLNNVGSTCVELVMSRMYWTF